MNDELGIGIEFVLIDSKGNHSPTLCGHMSPDERRLVTIKKDVSSYIQDAIEVQYFSYEYKSQRFKIIDYEEKLLSIEVYILYVLPFK